jgi:hypothetical protein
MARRPVCREIVGTGKVTRRVTVEGRGIVGAVGMRRGVGCVCVRGGVSRIGVRGGIGRIGVRSSLGASRQLRRTCAQRIWNGAY